MKGCREVRIPKRVGWLLLLASIVMIMDNQNRIYVVDLERNGVGISDSQGYRLLARDDSLLSWADGFAIYDGYLYITQNSLHLNPAMHSGLEGAIKPYHLVRIKLP